ncbi:MAG: DNA adenine methylase [Armatimonadaceae bacterium]
MPKQVTLSPNIKSPLRYPGGKSRAIKQIAEYLPKTFTEFREPFVGGGSVFLYIRRQFPDVTVWINDLNPELYRFWFQAQANLEELVERVREVKANRSCGSELFEELRAIDTTTLTDMERAVRFFVLNRISFSGTVEAGGYSEKAFHARFTLSSIDRLAQLKPLLSGVRITCLDYEEVIQSPAHCPEKTFLFLDPPYFSATESRLYGKNGVLHTSFDHQRFADVMERCPLPYLITYDDCLEVRANFAFAQQYEWELQYGMNNYMQGKAEKGKELFIANYEVCQKTSAINHPPEPATQLTLGME